MLPPGPPPSSPPPALPPPPLPPAPADGYSPPPAAPYVVKVVFSIDFSIKSIQNTSLNEIALAALGAAAVLSNGYASEVLVLRTVNFEVQLAADADPELLQVNMQASMCTASLAITCEVSLSRPRVRRLDRDRRRLMNATYMNTTNGQNSSTFSVVQYALDQVFEAKSISNEPPLALLASRISNVTGATVLLFVPMKLSIQITSTQVVSATGDPVAGSMSTLVGALSSNLSLPTHALTAAASAIYPPMPPPLLPPLPTFPPSPVPGVPPSPARVAISTIPPVLQQVTGSSTDLAMLLLLLLVLPVALGIYCIRRRNRIRGKLQVIQTIVAQRNRVKPADPADPAYSATHTLFPVLSGHRARVPAHALPRESGCIQNIAERRNRVQPLEAHASATALGVGLPVEAWSTSTRTDALATTTAALRMQGHMRRFAAIRARRAKLQELREEQAAVQLQARARVYLQRHALQKRQEDFAQVVSAERLQRRVRSRIAEKAADAGVRQF